MDGHDSDRVRHWCAASAPACGGRDRDRPRPAATVRHSSPRPRRGPVTPCAPGSRRRGLPAELGSCWYRRFPWSPLSWRSAGPHG